MDISNSNNKSIGENEGIMRGLITKRKKAQAEEALNTLGEESALTSAIQLDQEAGSAQNMSPILSKSSGTIAPDQLTQMILKSIQSQSGMSQPTLNDLPKFEPSSGITSSAKITPQGNIQQSGFLANLFGTSTKTLLDQLSTVSEIQKSQSAMSSSLTPNQIISGLGEAGMESRRIEAENRRQKEFKIENIEKFGASFAQDEIQDISDNLGIDLNSTIEAYGIPADRSGKFRIPPQKILDKKADMQVITPSEQEYFQDNLVLVDRLKESSDILSQMGITPEKFEQMGKIDYEEVQTNLGPISIPARFQLVGQLKGDRELVRLTRKMERLFQAYRKVITGAQASGKELQILRPLFPSATDRPGILLDAIKDIENETYSNMDSRLELMGSVGRDVSKLKPLVEQRRDGQVKIYVGEDSSKDKVSLLSDEDAYEEYKKMIGQK